MYIDIIYKSVEDFTHMVLFILSRTFLAIFINLLTDLEIYNKYKEYILGIYKNYEHDYKNITN